MLAWKAWEWRADAVHDLGAVVNGAEVRLDPCGALLVPAARALVVADLHLEKGSAYARRGRFLPPYDTGLTLACLANALQRHQPRTVVCLGDSFHDREGAERLGADERARLAGLMAGRRWLWIAGNHDPDPPKDLGGECAPEAQVASLVLRHEPLPGEAPGEIAGHLHPAARIVAAGRSVRRRAFLSDGTRLVMPAFGSLAGGLNVLDEAFRPLFPGAAPIAYMLGDKRVFAVAGTALRGD